jgi:hypothetical protein
MNFKANDNNKIHIKIKALMKKSIIMIILVTSTLLCTSYLVKSYEITIRNMLLQDTYFKFIEKDQKNVLNLYLCDYNATSKLLI